MKMSRLWCHKRMCASVKFVILGLSLLNARLMLLVLEQRWSRIGTKQLLPCLMWLGGGYWDQQLLMIFRPHTYYSLIVKQSFEVLEDLESLGILVLMILKKSISKHVNKTLNVVG